MLKCNECGKLSHARCAGRNSKMKQYICAICQLVKLDPFSCPVATLIKPFIVHKYQDATENEKNPVFPLTAAKVFKIEESF